jgi:hypothetical protein
MLFSGASVLHPALIFRTPIGLTAGKSGLKHKEAGYYSKYESTSLHQLIKIAIP